MGLEKADPVKPDPIARHAPVPLLPPPSHIDLRLPTSAYAATTTPPPPKLPAAAHIIKLPQDLPESSRADAVSSMVYEAEARLRDPVYGCAGAVSRLQREANELKVHLARAQADLLGVQAQHANLLALVCVEFAAQHRGDGQQQQQQHPPTPMAGDQLNGFGAAGDAVYLQSLCADSDDLDSAAWEEARRQLWT